MRITVELLREHGACEEHVNLFKQFLNGRQYILTTNRNIQLAYKYGLNVIWACEAGLIKLDGCYEDADGNKYWYQNGKYHRVDGPAVENADGYKAWFQNGKRHRLDGPAVEYANGAKSWWQNDQRHRLDGPAIEYAIGTKLWYQNDQLHRLDGPAIEWANGAKSWRIEGKELTEAEFNEIKNRV